jgi:hypothetical protein
MKPEDAAWVNSYSEEVLDTFRANLSRLGGELSHSMFAARSRTLDYSLELEKKITDGNFADERTPPLSWPAAVRDF